MTSGISEIFKQCVGIGGDTNAHRNVLPIDHFCCCRRNGCCPKSNKSYLDDLAGVESFKKKILEKMESNIEYDLLRLKKCEDELRAELKINDEFIKNIFNRNFDIEKDVDIEHIKSQIKSTENKIDCECVKNCIKSTETSKEFIKIHEELVKFYKELLEIYKNNLDRNNFTINIDCETYAKILELQFKKSIESFIITNKYVEKYKNYLLNIFKVMKYDEFRKNIYNILPAITGRLSHEIVPVDTNNIVTIRQRDMFLLDRNQERKSLDTSKKICACIAIVKKDQWYSAVETDLFDDGNNRYIGNNEHHDKHNINNPKFISDEQYENMKKVLSQFYINGNTSSDNKGIIRNIINYGIKCEYKNWKSCCYITKLPEFEDLNDKIKSARACGAGCLVFIFIILALAIISTLIAITINSL